MEDIQWIPLSNHPKEKPCCREYLYTNNEKLISILKYHARHWSPLESKFLSALIMFFLCVCELNFVMNWKILGKRRNWALDRSFSWGKGTPVISHLMKNKRNSYSNTDAKVKSRYQEVILKQEITNMWRRLRVFRQHLFGNCLKISQGKAWIVKTNTLVCVISSNQQVCCFSNSYQQG